jgi:hypothetical protein
MRDQQAKNKRTFIVVSIVVGWLIFGGFVGYLIGQSRSRNDFRIFNPARINGKIEYVYQTKGGDLFRLQGSGISYHFASTMKQINETIK